MASKITSKHGFLYRQMSLLGSFFIESVSYFGALMRLNSQFLKMLFRKPFEWRAIIHQCEIIGLNSMPIAMMILLFVGLVFALQFGQTLQTMGAVPYVGKVTSLSIIRELGPVFTSLVVGGRIGAGIAAELSSMVVTEQVDAIRALGANPIKKLVVTRILATILMLPLVALFADLMGVLGGLIISVMQFGLTTTYFVQSVIETIHLTDFISGFLKPIVFGYGVALIACYEGLNCRLGTEGVGRATTRTVVNIAIMTVLTDFIMSQIVAMLPRI